MMLLRTRLMRYTVAAMFLASASPARAFGVSSGDIGSLVPPILLVAFVVLFRSSGRSLLLRRFPTTTCLFVVWCAPVVRVVRFSRCERKVRHVLSVALTLVSIAVAAEVLH